MRYLLIISLLLCSCLSFSQIDKFNSFVKKLPDRNQTVNDFGKFLSRNESDTLNEELQDYLKRSSNAIVVVTLESLTDPKTDKEFSIEEAAMAYFNSWGVGDKEKNNGVMLMISREPRRVRIQVGSGLENMLTNDVCQQIVDNNLVPDFEAGSFYTGIQEAVRAIEYQLDHPSTAQAIAPYLRPAIKSEIKEKPYGHNNPVIAFSIIGGIILVCFLYVKYGKPLSSGWFTRNGYTTNDWTLFGTHSYRGSSGGGGSSSSGGYSGGGGYGGGSSSGGGASGSW
jgi:uncharacterized protein